jgi:hypothetical protein
VLLEKYYGSIRLLASEGDEAGGGWDDKWVLRRTLRGDCGYNIIMGIYLLHKG